LEEEEEDAMAAGWGLGEQQPGKQIVQLRVGS